MDNDEQLKSQWTKEITAILAADPKGLIGKGEGLPWSFPEELEGFTNRVKGGLMIMGMNTYQGTPHMILNNSINIVFTSSGPPIRAKPERSSVSFFVTSLTHFFTLAQKLQTCTNMDDILCEYSN